MATHTLRGSNGSRSSGTGRDRDARADGVAVRPGVRIHAALRRAADQRVGQRPGRRARDCGLRRLVPRGACRIRTKRSCASFRRISQVTTARPLVERVPVAPDQVRAWLPVHTYPVSAGVKGGWAGSVAMAALACAYGVLKAGSIWYPINLLAAAVYAQSVLARGRICYSFHAGSFAVAVAAARAGLDARGPALRRDAADVPAAADPARGLIAPVLWSGLLWSILGLAQSAAGEPHRLALVRGVAGGLRRGRRPRRRPADPDADARERLVRAACRRRSARAHAAARRRRGHGR